MLWKKPQDLYHTQAKMMPYLPTHLGNALVPPTPRSKTRKVLRVPEDMINNYGTALIRLSKEIKSVFKREQRCLEVQSPVYVFGDIHGNMEDLIWLANKLWPLGQSPSSV